MSKVPVLEPVQDQALDIQHDTDPAEDHGPARRIPNLGHALFFFSLAWFFLNLCSLLVATAAHIHTEQAATEHPGLVLLAEALSYLVTLGVAFWIFPRLWQRPFSFGIEWNLLALRRRWYWLIPLAIPVSFAAQFADRYTPPAKDDLVSKLLVTPHGAWAMTAFGVLLAPLAEEIAFRGFLLPALATAYDWLALERTPAGLQRWQNSTGHSAFALVFGAIFSSVPFALLHAGQVAHAWVALSVLFGVSLVLSAVRIRCHSVACSVFFHSIYNFVIFSVVFIETGGYRHFEHLLS
jgi:membrane protease YdiL (CAAX protease family)